MSPIWVVWVARPGHSSRCETERTKLPKDMLRDLVSRTERTLRQSQRLVKELLHLRLLTAV